MPRRKGAAIPAAPRKTLLEWIETDDGDTSGPPHPPCTEQTQAIHRRLLLDPQSRQNETAEPLIPPVGLRLPPLG
ncbi:hypothetical protein H5V43_22005 (plasmid) [Sphingobium fuliginis]|uniref:Uncharacterized protein n=1 Tax=Sphingobium fuliginis (strain ATCC 27551) TaxID=336203 RepID=A0A7M2GP69_SPHSA|nr:hypothetical protein [Sphingobium fuliginis]QOT74546.1 hypothetical protein H5V43_22005 [Sphingobium fuliginis]